MTEALRVELFCSVEGWGPGHEILEQVSKFRLHTLESIVYCSVFGAWSLEFKAPGLGSRV